MGLPKLAIMDFYTTRFLLFLSAFLGTANAQKVTCTSLAGGCDGGTAHQSAVESAIARFEVDMLYGGDAPIVFSSALDTDSLAGISYTCLDGSNPPQLNGSAIQSR